MNAEESRLIGNCLLIAVWLILNIAFRRKAVSLWRLIENDIHRVYDGKKRILIWSASRFRCSSVVFSRRVQRVNMRAIVTTVPLRFHNLVAASNEISNIRITRNDAKLSNVILPRVINSMRTDLDNSRAPFTISFEIKEAFDVVRIPAD